MKRKSRGNGQGTAYKRGRTWTAQVVIGYKYSQKPGGQRVPIKRTKGGFGTKAAAIAACAWLGKSQGVSARMTLKDVYNAWEASYSPRVGPSTMVNYKAAYKHFSALHDTYIDMITARDLQDCMDKCPAGKRTHENMKCVAGLLWAYAYDANIVEKKVTEHLYTGTGVKQQREPLTDKDVDRIRNAMTDDLYAEYVYALCYLGFRPGEFLALTKESLNFEDGVAYLVGGSKTTAGKSRRVPVPYMILPIIDKRFRVKDTEYLFPQRVYNRKGELTGYKKMSDEYFNKHVFKPLMQRLGIVGKVPYGARHTYSDKLKHADGDDKTKAAIFGHTDYSFTQKKYQSTTIEDIKKVSESIK